jgi:hypothetical protein
MDNVGGRYRMAGDEIRDARTDFERRKVWCSRLSLRENRSRNRAPLLSRSRIRSRRWSPPFALLASPRTARADQTALVTARALVEQMLDRSGVRTPDGFYQDRISTHASVTREFFQQYKGPLEVGIISVVSPTASDLDKLNGVVVPRCRMDVVFKWPYRSWSTALSGR